MIWQDLRFPLRQFHRHRSRAERTLIRGYLLGTLDAPVSSNFRLDLPCLVF
jgi:hypothetical protein